MALRNMPSLPTATSLLRALIDPKCFYKIRMEAAYALAKVKKSWAIGIWGETRFIDRLHTIIVWW